MDNKDLKEPKISKNDIIKFGKVLIITKYVEKSNIVYFNDLVLFISEKDTCCVFDENNGKLQPLFTQEEKLISDIYEAVYKITEDNE